MWWRIWWRNSCRASPNGCRREEGGGRGRPAARVQGCYAPALPSSLYRHEGAVGAPQTHLGPAKGGNLAPKEAPRVLGASHGPAAWAFRERVGQPKWAAAPPLGPCGPSRFVAPQGGALRNLLEPSRIILVPCRKIPELAGNPGNHFPYMKLYLRTLPELLMMSRISYKTPNHHSFIPSKISSPSYIEALSV